MNGQFVELTTLDSSEVQSLTNFVDSLDSVDYAVTETSRGLGIELWRTDSSERFK